MIHCRVSGRTSPVGDRLTICGGATVNGKVGRQCVQTLLMSQNEIVLSLSSQII